VAPLFFGWACVYASSHLRQARLTTHYATHQDGDSDMSGTQRDQIEKKESGKKAAKAQQGKGILETVRQKMAYTLRGI
jgi:hypothetical protein